MPLWPDLTARSDLPELMDSPDSDGRQLCNTLKQLRAINRVMTPYRRLFRRYFFSEMMRDRQRCWSLLDIGAGGCDMGLWFFSLCRTHRIDVKITCLDHDPRVVEFARTQCAGVDGIEIVEADALQLGPNRQWDFVFANHLLHHLSDEQIVKLLRRIDSISLRQFVISDIRRSYPTYFGYTALAAIWLRDSFAFYDGRLSIRRAFTWHEFAALADRAEMRGRLHISSLFPGHLAMISQPEGEQPLGRS